ncbi:uncharacterized protein LOC121265935 [Juglans microcarpa x Juglans regia]|uniref:uncharacterized protein LOC121265935 n=1 Tax=Juglans microcarpa x Juglans regia TaxID=2249226 RepID=UPI001B7E950F|nr:uncharacterized protein LOC121265935 [Juglans microcarpa x Juglans regia]
MAVAGAPKGNPAPTMRSWSFADMVTQSPLHLPEVDILLRPPKMIDAELCVMFSPEEIHKSAQPFVFSLVMKFLRQRPSLDVIRSFVRSRWGLESQLVVSSMRKPRNVFLKFSKEDDFLKAFSREACDVEGVPYRFFHWMTDFSEDVEPACVPVWVILLGLSLNFYHESFLRNLLLPIGRYIRQDNSTRCATRTDGARVCVEMNATAEPHHGFWIGAPRQPNSRFQVIKYETLPAYCVHCSIQGHNKNTCKKEFPKEKSDGGRGERENEGLKWVKKSGGEKRDIAELEEGEIEIEKQSGKELCKVSNCVEDIVLDGDELQKGREIDSSLARNGESKDVLGESRDGELQNSSADRNYWPVSRKKKK